MSKKQEEAAVVVADKKTKVTVYKAGGQDVKLSTEIVRNYLVKGDGNVSDQDIIQFISICKYNQLNPFLGEAQLIKYGTYPPTMVVTKEAFFKRAEQNENYDGIEAGVIVMRGDEQVELEGTFTLPSDVLLGGWAKVYRKDKTYPTVSRVSLKEYNADKALWKGKPATMICKVAKVQALREAFPNQLGAMYIKEENRNDAQAAGTRDVPYTEVPDETPKAVSMVEAAMAKANGRVAKGSSQIEEAEVVPTDGGDTEVPQEARVEEPAPAADEAKTK